MELFFVVFSVI